MKLHSLLLSFVLAGSLAHGAIVGIETFSYPNGPINGLSGGTGWNVSGGTSDWGGGSAQVVSGGLVTDANNGAFREYGGNESASAFQGTGIAYYKFTLTIGAVVPNYAGLSSFDFGSERVFFGRFSDGEIGIDESFVGTTSTGVNAAPNTTYNFIAVIDYTNQVLSLFLNPDANDVYNPAAPSGAGNTANAIRTGYATGNWSSRIRLQSGFQSAGVAPVTWDNITVATAPGDVGLQVPEPGSLALCAFGGVLLARRRRR